MDKILADPRLRKWFIPVVLLIIVLLGVVRWAWLSDLQQTRLDRKKPDPSIALDAAARVIEGLASSLLVAFGIALLLYWANKDVVRVAVENEIIAPTLINDRFKAAQTSTTTWYFRGSLGRYFTAKTVPALIETGKNGLHFSAQIVNPFNSAICEYVSKCRSGKMTPDEVRLEALATTVEYVRLIQMHYSQVAMATGRLLDQYLPFRIDLCDLGAFTTHDDEGAAAFFHAAGSPYHDGRLQELTLDMRQGLCFDVLAVAVSLQMPETEQKKVDASYVEAVVAAVVHATGIESGLAEGEAAKVATKVSSRKSPY